MKLWTCWPALVDSLYLPGALSPIPREDPHGSDGKQVHFSTRAPAWIEVPGNARHWTYRTAQNGEEQPRSVLSRREIIVVGGSAAGLFTAASVARGGRPVRVLESKPQLAPDSGTGTRGATSRRRAFLRYAFLGHWAERARLASRS